MTLDDLMERFAGDLTDAEQKRDGAIERARAAHQAAITAADQMRDRAVRIADAHLDELLIRHSAEHEQASRRALERFDTSARNVLGVPDGFSVVSSNNAMQLLASDGRTVLASASYFGPPGWAIDGPEGRTFLGQARDQVRASLWRIAASV